MAVERMIESKAQMPFEKRYRRLTTYIENDLFCQIQSLREAGVIKITPFFNQCLKKGIAEIDE